MQINSTILASLWLRSYMLKIHNIFALLSVGDCGVGTELNFLSLSSSAKQFRNRSRYQRDGYHDTSIVVNNARLEDSF